MAVRTSMKDLVGKIRTLVGDPTTSGAFPNDTGGLWSNQELQDFLDQRRLEVRFDILSPSPTVSAGTYTYVDYYHPLSYWENDAVLKDASYAVLAPTTSEWLIGHWAFAAGQIPPVFIWGKTYDVNGVAADVLEAWAAKEKLSFDVATDMETFTRSQKREALLELADYYRKRSRPVMGIQQRTDENLAAGVPGPVWNTPTSYVG